MTKKLENTLGLASPEDLDLNDDGADESPLTSNDEKLMQIFEETDDIVEQMSVSEQVDFEMSSEGTLAQHDIEMDSIAEKALIAHKQLLDISVTVTDNYVARLYEVSSTMLKVAMDANDSKANRKLKTLEMKIKKMKHDNDSGNGKGVNSEGNNGSQLSRNEVLSMIASQKNK